MKKVLRKISILLILLSKIIVVNAQFVSIPTGTTNSLNDISFPNDSIGYIVGDYGIIKKSIDGGLNWTNLTSGVTNSLKAVSFLNSNVGYVVGLNGIILKTIDGGTTWNTLSTGLSNYSFLDLDFVNIDTGYVVGVNGKILKTTNGGTTWTVLESYTTYELYSVFFINPNIGYVAGYNGKILKTTNGGLNWTNLVIGSYSNINSIFFIDSITGYVAGENGRISKTTDGGITWTNQNSGTTSEIKSICFMNSNIGYVVGNTGLVRKTNNGGLNWNVKNFPVNYNLTRVSFKEDNTVFVIGQWGTLCRSLNGGSFWDLLNIPTDNHLSSLYFCNENIGYVTGNGQILLKTFNGGTSFTLLTNNLPYTASSIYFTDTIVGYCSLYNGSIIKTIDGGINWTTQYSGTTNALYSITFIDPYIGYSVGVNGTILKTTDSGAHWIIQNSGTTSYLLDVFFVNIDTGFVVGSEGTILKTTNGGQDWILQINEITNTLYSVFFTDINTGFAVGSSGKILKTTNNGANWILQTSGTTNDLYSVCFSDANIGCAVGNNGIILKTTNAGLNWTTILSEVESSLNSVFFNDYNIGYIVGSDGLILKSSICSGIPADIDGITSFCLPTGNYIYTSIGAPFATSYTWNFEPLSAGTISTTGSSVTITWSSSFNGIASLRLQGVKNGCIGEWKKKKVVVSNGNLGYFNLNLPLNGAWITSTPFFKWTSSNGSDKYSLYVDGILKKDSIIETNYQIQPNEALTSGIHTWYLMSNSGCAIQSAETRSLLVDATPPLAYNLLTPLNNSWTSNSLPTFTWNPSIDSQSGLRYYQLWIDGVLNRDSIPTTITSITPINVLDNGTHLWNVKAIDVAGNVRISSETWTIKVDNLPPGNNMGSSLFFNGINNYVEIQNNAAYNLNNGFTIEVWIKPNLTNISTYQHPTILAKELSYNESEGDWSLFLEGDLPNPRKIAFKSNGLSTLVTSNLINLNEYNHIAVTIKKVQNTSFIKIYINGVLGASTSYSTPFHVTPSNVFVGKRFNYYPYNDYFNGNIDEIRFWNYERSSSQINEFKNVALNSNTPNLIGYWRFNEGTGNTIYDLSNLHNDGLINGALFENSSINSSRSLCNIKNPINNQFILPNNQNFLWNTAVDSGVGFKKYQLWIDHNLTQDNITDTTCTLLNPLSYGKHVWYVKGYDSLDNNQDSYYVNFYVDNVPPNPFNLLIPINNAIAMIPTPDLSWQATTDSTGGCGLSKYQLWINGVINRDSIPINTTTVSPANVLPQGAYSWYVKAYDKLGNVRQSTETHTFYIDWEMPSIFNLIAPYDNETLSISNPSFSWHPSSDMGSGIAYYEITISGNQPIVVPSTDTSYNLTFHLPNGYYSWFVKAYDYSGSFISSNTNNFTINESLPEQASIPIGSNEVCQNAQSTTFTTIEVNHALTYLWNISPSNAGTISGDGLNATVIWNASFSGVAQITVTGQNLVGLGNPSLPLSVTVHAISNPGTISGPSAICLDQPTTIITLSNYNGTILKWQKKFNTEDWIDINNTISTYSEIIQTVGLYQYRAEVQNETCPPINSNICSVTVGDIPSSGGTISGPSIVCQNQNGVSYSIPPINGALYYEWTLPSGVSGVSTTNTISVNFLNNALSDSIHVKGVNNCGNGPESIIAVTVNPLPANAGTISGIDTLCQNTMNVTFTVPIIENATSYIWTLPSGSSGTSSTNSITVNFGTSAISGNITVKGHNSCGNGITSTKWITVRTLPSAAGTISGFSNVCVGQNSELYTVPSISNATSYVWTLPTGATGTSTTNSIYVSFGTSAISGNITVKGVNSCGNGAISSKMITVKTIPADAGVISGLSNVCQGQNGVIYNVPTITNATVYEWTLPNGYSGSSPTNSISINFGSSAISGNITVIGGNVCGFGNSSSKSIIVSEPLGLTGLISGNSNVCQGATNEIYTIPAVTNATSYVWTLPTGASGTSTTNTIAVNFGTNAISGNMSVKPSNSCGYGYLSIKAISVNHNSANTIETTVCDSYTAPDGQIYTTSGTKIAVIPNAEGCDSTITINLTVNETPETPTITQQQYQLISSSSEGNQWYNQNGIILNETNQELLVTASGTYYVIVTQANCHSQPSNFIYVNYVQVNPYENDYISISPNPFTNQLMIKNQSSESYRYYIYNSIGQQILQGIIENEVSINTSDLSKGLYIIKFVNSLGQTYYKVIKQ